MISTVLSFLANKKHSAIYNASANASRLVFATLYLVPEILHVLCHRRACPFNVRRRSQKYHHVEQQSRKKACQRMMMRACDRNRIKTMPWSNNKNLYVGISESLSTLPSYVGIRSLRMIIIKNNNNNNKCRRREHEPTPLAFPRPKPNRRQDRSK